VIFSINWVDFFSINWNNFKVLSLSLSQLNVCFTLDAGNPRVTPEVTRHVCLLARMMAANLYYSQIEDLMFEVPSSFYILQSFLRNFISLVGDCCLFIVDVLLITIS
jgi:hypothetical protein